jgi:DNA-binding NarL/FixJ family response regulator
MQPIRTLLADDNPAFLASLLRFLADRPGVQVLGTARSGREALLFLAQHHPDLVLLDLTMPDLNGLEVLTLLKAQPNAPRVIMLTLHDEPELRRASREAGADDYVTKVEIPERLLPAVEALFPRRPADGADTLSA